MKLTHQPSIFRRHTIGLSARAAGLCVVAALLAALPGACAQSSGFNGLGMNMGNLSRLSRTKTRSISAENFTGEKGKGGMATEGTGKNAARDLGRGWKVSPCVVIKPGQTFEIADIKGPGAIQHIWMTPTGHNRFSILRMYWDGEKQPSIECPVAPRAVANRMPPEPPPETRLCRSHTLTSHRTTRSQHSAQRARYVLYSLPHARTG